MVFLLSNVWVLAYIVVVPINVQYKLIFIVFFSLCFNAQEIYVLPTTFSTSMTMENVEATYTLGLNDISFYEEDRSQATTATLVSNSCNNEGGDLDQQRDPTVGMWFETEEEVKKIDKDYAIRKGFGVRTRTSQKDLDGNISYLKLVCSQEGKYVSGIPPEKKTQRTQRKNCPAQMIALKREGKWCIKTLVDEHSHDISPGKSRLIRGNRIINMHAQRTLDINDEAGVELANKPVPVGIARTRPRFDGESPH